MKRIDRYILTTVIKATLTALLVLIVLTFVLTLMEELEDVGRGSYEMMDAMLVALSATPRFMFEAFPVSALIGGLLGMGGLAGSGELVAMRAAGLSVMQILGAVFKAGVVLVVLVVVTGDLLAPTSEQYGQRLRLEQLNKQVTFRSKHGFWAKDQETFVNIREATPLGELRDVTIYELTPDHHLQRIIRARAGVYEDGRWLLKQVRSSRLQEQRLVHIEQEQLAWKSVVDPAMLSAAFVEPFALSAWELYGYMQLLEAGGQRATRWAVAFWSKLAVPLTMLGMLLLSVPLVMGAGRQASAGQRVLVGALVGILFYLVSKGFSFLVVGMSLPAVLVAFFPLAAFAAAMAWLYRKGSLR